MGGLFKYFGKRKGETPKPLSREDRLLEQYMHSQSTLLLDGRPSITMWYSMETGDLYGFGDGNPSLGKKDCTSVRLIGRDEVPENISPEVMKARGELMRLKKRFQD